MKKNSELNHSELGEQMFVTRYYFQDPLISAETFGHIFNLLARMIQAWKII